MNEIDKTNSNSATHTDSPKPDNVSFDPDRTMVNSRVRRERGELQVGDVVLNRYELLEKLGSGAMGVVFKCSDQVSQVEYALKIVPPELVRDADAMEDIRENFQLIHGLKHPNIASADFLDRDEYGTYFLIMEYAGGESLAQWLRRKWKNGRPDLSEVANIVRQIASALDYAHSQHILHRDVKPANVMVDDNGRVKVLDFGLASQVRSTMTTMSINPSNTSGTPNYLAPEQFKGRYPTPASDQYALGVLTYQMLSGHLPFDSDDYNVLRSAVLNEAPEPIDGLPDAINQCLSRVLSKDPKKRFSSCAEFAEALVGTKIPYSTWMRGRKVWFSLAAITAVVLLAIGILVWCTRGPADKVVAGAQDDTPEIATDERPKPAPTAANKKSIGSAIPSNPKQTASSIGSSPKQSNDTLIEAFQAGTSAAIDKAHSDELLEERRIQSSVAFAMLKDATVPDNAVFFAHKDGELGFVTWNEATKAFYPANAFAAKVEKFPFVFLTTPDAASKSEKPGETVVFYENPLQFFDGIFVVFGDGSVKYLEGDFDDNTDALDCAANTFDISNKVAVELIKKGAEIDRYFDAPKRFE